MLYIGNVITGAKGFIAGVSNGYIGYEIHPMGEANNREFYSHDAAQGLADRYADRLNNEIDPCLPSLIRLA